MDFPTKVAETGQMAECTDMDIEDDIGQDCDCPATSEASQPNEWYKTTATANKVNRTRWTADFQQQEKELKMPPTHALRPKYQDMQHNNTEKQYRTTTNHQGDQHLKEEIKTVSLSGRETSLGKVRLCHPARLYSIDVLVWFIL